MLTPAKKVKPQDYSGWGYGFDPDEDRARSERFEKFLRTELDKMRDKGITDIRKMLADLANKGCDVWWKPAKNDIQFSLAPSVGPREYDAIWTLSLRDALKDQFDPNDEDDAKDRKKVAALLRALADEIEAGK